MKFSKLKEEMNKKGVFGLDSVKAFFSILLAVALLSFIIIVIMGTLTDSTILTAGSLAKNQSDNVLTNVSSGITSFFGSLSSVFTVLAVVVIILALVVLVRIVGGGRSGGSL